MKKNGGSYDSYTSADCCLNRRNSDFAFPEDPEFRSCYLLDPDRHPRIDRELLVQALLG